MSTYRNPRMTAAFTDWPSGSHRVYVIFTIERHPKRGERATRVTQDPLTGRTSAPKALTYARAARIVDGDDGKTYIIELTLYGTISVMQSNMQYQAESVAESDPRYAALRAMFEVPA